MTEQIEVQWANNHWILDVSGACYLPDYQTLLISDFHIGKVQHFRKNGIAIPVAAARANLNKLEQVMAKFKPKRLIFLGDLFHSEINTEVAFLQHIRTRFAHVALLLVPGNHDANSLSQQAQLFTLTPEKYALGGMILQHHPPETAVSVPTVHGHWHPAYAIKGKAGQRLRLACFAFSEKTAVLPAFGMFTGKSDLPDNEKWQNIVVMSKEGLFQIPQSLLR